MEALVYHGPRQMVVAEVPEPVPGPGEALVRVRAVGICGSELEGYLGLNSLRTPPLVMGHEFCGEVVALGPGAEAGGVPVGTLVAVNPFVSCGACAACRSGRTQLCAGRSLIGAHRPGAFAPLVAAPVAVLAPLPPDLPPMIGALAEPFATALHAAALGQVGPGDGVVVWGAGSIGLLCVRAARLAGADRVVAVDTNPSRLAAARAMGADAVLDAAQPDTVARVRAELGGAARVVALEAVGRSRSRRDCVAAVGAGGAAVFVGLHDAETTLPVNDMIRAEVALFCSYAYSAGDFTRAAAILAEGPLPTTDWVEVRPLRLGPASFDELLDAPGAVTKIVLEP